MDPAPHAPLPMPIAIVGMMAAGKTTLGRALAAALDVSYFDSDEMIEAVGDGNGRALAEVRGVEWLHALEASVLAHQLDHGEPGVISAAASVVDSVDCRRLLEQRAVVCWVDVPVHVLESRIELGEHRRSMAHDELRGRYTERVPRFQEMADVRIDGLEPLGSQVASVVAHLVGQAS
jgi:shikimate kinase